MRRSAAILLLLALAPSVAAQDVSGDFQRGKIRSKSEQCQECHGEAGISTSDHYPKLAGQWAAYIRKQLNDFQSGARKNEIMTAMASGLSKQDISDIAAYFSGSPRWHAEEADISAVGRKLFENGDPSRGLPACAGCHGAKGIGAKGGGADANESPIPAIGGQRQSYLTSQLHFWKIADRENSPGGVMNAVTEKLANAEIEALAKFLAGQQPDR